LILKPVQFVWWHMLPVLNPKQVIEWYRVIHLIIALII